MVSVFTRTLGRNYSPVIQTCLSLHLVHNLGQGSLPHMAAALSCGFGCLCLIFWWSSALFSPATQVSGCFAVLWCLPRLFWISFLSCFYPTVRFLMYSIAETHPVSASFGAALWANKWSLLLESCLWNKTDAHNKRCPVFILRLAQVPFYPPCFGSDVYIGR